MCIEAPGIKAFVTQEIFIRSCVEFSGYENYVSIYTTIIEIVKFTAGIVGCNMSCTFSFLDVSCLPRIAIGHLFRVTHKGAAPDWSQMFMIALLIMPHLIMSHW